MRRKREERGKFLRRRPLTSRYIDLKYSFFYDKKTETEREKEINYLRSGSIFVSVSAPFGAVFGPVVTPPVGVGVPDAASGRIAGADGVVLAGNAAQVVGLFGAEWARGSGSRRGQ